MTARIPSSKCCEGMKEKYSNVGGLVYLERIKAGTFILREGYQSCLMDMSLVQNYCAECGAPFIESTALCESGSKVSIGPHVEFRKGDG